MTAKAKKTPFERRNKLRGLIWAALFIGLICGVTAGGLLSLTRDLPQIKSLEDFRPSAITRVYSSDQVLLAELFIERRDPVTLEQIPAHLQRALLTTEDRKFYQHNGIDIKGILRAAVKNILRRRLSEGASTLTQQLAKTLFLTPRKTFTRKLKEAVLALQLERRYTKKEILELYLNQIYFGSGAYGVASAARIYFNKAIEDLNLTECALIAGLPKAPSRYSPLVHPDLATRRRDIVLKQMLITGVIDEAAYAQAVSSPVAVSPRDPQGRKALEFVEYIKNDLEDNLGDNLLYKGGLTIYTTLVYRHQEAAEAAVASGLEDLRIRMQHNGRSQATPQAALVSLDVKTGRIISMVGGLPGTRNSYNRAAAALRQPGSAFKPIVYAFAIEKGFGQNQLLLDAPVVFRNADGISDWQPQNFSEGFSGEVSMRWALAHSKNIPAVRLIEKIGPSSVVQFAHTMGITSNLKPNLSLALGTSETTLLELSSAFNVFANQGKYIRPYAIMEIRNHEGDTIWRTKPEQRIVLSRASAAIMTDMLSAVMKEGTGRSAGYIYNALAGKTGTTNEYRDALFIGYSPNMVSGVWVGNDDATSLGPYETGARAALPIWKKFMQTALDDQPPAYFDVPDDTQYILMDPKSGRQATSASTTAVKALVKKQ